MPGYLALAAATAMYALGIVAQTVAARRAAPGHGFGLLARLVSDRLYLLGFAGQVGGFALAFFARAELPLYLVQAGSSCAVGVATVFGVLVLGWRVRPVEVVVLVTMAVGLLLLAAASAPSVAEEIPTDTGFLLLGVPLVVVFLVSRKVSGVVPIAVAAGLAYAVVAIASRSLADEPLVDLPFYPLLWLMVAAALVGQACMAVALQRGGATSTVATMDSVTVVVTSAVGVLALGDRIAPGREWWVAAGVGLVVLGVLTLGYASRPVAAPPAAERETV
ncbi:hypothetical protein ABZ816_19270 [Actinosynnema sp. NPDC047251]|uniref:Uncharacterized protein n=1 Tax=Saccharothrix espanaensis (strain ATCC 51144 / DSM 44229 / JCM 9112 / NBRC 15066 / NRRL 15764) TaxID=1179773 RepID=K0K8P4_SACES|nr:hypothetical protein [Saccharothrix espanaensis]CCH33199.1 hypothetical protein BN6_59430 [Saccharothrix espanaensis DSM 44229]